MQLAAFCEEEYPPFRGIRSFHPRRVLAAVFEITPATAEACDRSNRRSQRYCAVRSNRSASAFSRSSATFPRSLNRIFIVLFAALTPVYPTACNRVCQRRLSKDFRNLALTEHRRERQGLFFLTCSVALERAGSESRRSAAPVGSASWLGEQRLLNSYTITITTTNMWSRGSEQIISLPLKVSYLLPSVV